MYKYYVFRLFILYLKENEYLRVKRVFNVSNKYTHKFKMKKYSIKLSQNIK